MTPLHFALIVFTASLAAGLLGSLLGLGGGIIVVPVLTLLLHVDIRYAIGASIVSVIATSSGAAAAYVKEHITNIRVAMFLELATTSGAITGAYLAGLIADRWLFLLFGIFLGVNALQMGRKLSREDEPLAVTPDALSERLGLHGDYYDERLGRVIAYRVTGSRAGFGLMYVAGLASGLLGIGSGALKVAALDLAMKLPIKVSTATSNFMIGVTAAASAGIFFARGDIDPFIAAPVAAGVLGGALAGSRLLGKLSSGALRVAFVVVLVVLASEMVVKGVRP